MTIPDWIYDYLTTEVLIKLVEWLREGRSDAWIANYWNSSPEIIRRMRLRWHIFRAEDGECPDCGEQLNTEVCNNGRCIRNWCWETNGKIYRSQVQTKE